jgi:hypothetical protein
VNIKPDVGNVAPAHHRSDQPPTVAHGGFEPVFVQRTAAPAALLRASILADSAEAPIGRWYAGRCPLHLLPADPLFRRTLVLSQTDSLMQNPSVRYPSKQPLRRRPDLELVGVMHVGSAVASQIERVRSAAQNRVARMAATRTRN